MSGETSHPYEQLVVAHNPTSFSHAKAKAQTDALHSSGIIDVTYVETDPRWEITQAALLENVTERSLVGVIGGDKTKQIVAKGWLHKDADRFPQVPLAFFNGGNVDDAYFAFNGGRSPGDILLKGGNSRIHLVEVLLKYPDDSEETDYALSYAGVGSVAETCFGHGVLKKEARQNWFSELKPIRRTREGIHTVTVAGRYAGFCIVDKDTKGKEKLTRVQDVTCLHSSSIAAAGKTHTDHWQPDMEVVTSRKRGIGRAALSMLMLSMGAKYGEKTTEVCMKVRAVRNEEEGGPVVDSVPLELDGDAVRIPNDTEVTMRLSGASVLVRSTRGPR